MKKSLVAVLLSLVALTMVAGAAFAGPSFSITATIDEVDQDVEVEDYGDSLDSKDIAAGADVPAKFGTLKTSEFKGKTVEFAASDDVDGYELTVFEDEAGKLAEVSEIAENGEYILGVASKDFGYAFKVTVTISGGEEQTKQLTVDAVDSGAITAIESKFPNVQNWYEADAFVTLSDDLYQSFKETLDALAFYTGAINIDKENAGVRFKITLPSGLDAEKVLQWLYVLLGEVDDEVFVEDGDTNINDVFYYADGEVKPEDVIAKGTVNVAFEVPETGWQTFGAKAETKEPSGKSPSGGCDMGLLSGVALFAVALLSLRKSK